jgi:glutaredoxin
MKRKTIADQCVLGLAALLCAAGASAQVYKWKDDKGVIHFSDSVPPTVRDKAEVRAQGSADAGPALPYELARAARANPVTLYTSSGCAPCDQARSFLQRRGIPYAEKSVNSSDDSQKLKEAGSDGQLPLLVVGHNKLIGFAQGAWTEALDAAAYPAQPALPPGYQFAAATPAAPARPSEKALAQAAAERAARAAAEAEEQARFAPSPPPPVNGTPDFRF